MINGNGVRLRIRSIRGRILIVVVNNVVRGIFFFKFRWHNQLNPVIRKD
jgi:hypothetical protein